MANSNLLIIGYGNTLRQDDGVGVKVAEAVAEMNLPGVEVITRHQLVPELAECIAYARAVIFVDAAKVREGLVELKPVKAAAGAQILAHACDPGTLLALAERLFNHQPTAWSLAIPVENFGMGEGLSPMAEAGLYTAVEQIRAMAGLKPVPVQRLSLTG